VPLERSRRRGGWSDSDIPDLSGRSAIVTGANSGLGFQVALRLADHGASVVMACRSTVKGAAAAALIAEASPGAAVEVMPLDLGDLSSVRRFADSYHNDHDGVDLLINNAGVMAIPKMATTNGFETQFGTNYLGHFALTGLLLPGLLARPGARVVTVSSLVALIGRIHFNDLQGDAAYHRWLAYAQSKLANLLFAFELARRVSVAELDLVSVAAHPGAAATNLQTTSAALRGSRLATQVTAVGIRSLQSASQGAMPLLYAATAPGLRGGEYFGPAQQFGTRGAPTRVRPPHAGRNAETARRLWQVSEQLTDVHFGGLRLPVR
jgi:NAD(P)-dependent dehydrogenase (short-subunit alcohol dehydrogenase family)